jgi:adenine/guanine phosphoribosyltransferase-like PRPP-binding protein
MTDHPLLSSFVAHLRAALPDDIRIQQLLSTLSAPVYSDLSLHLAEQIGAQLKGGLDVVLALPDGLGLAEPLAAALGLRVVPITGGSGGWQFDRVVLHGHPRGLLVGRELSGGVSELEVCVMAEQAGCEVRALACALERSTSPGRHRLLQLGVQTFTAVRVAEIPGADQAPNHWIIERRQLDGNGLRPR